MRLVLGVVVGALVVGAVVPVAGAAGNSPPLADAGLDQRAVVDETVLLDGSGSWDPDGELVAVRWEIGTPDGATRAPSCPDCLRTRFVPDRPGVYEARLTVTDRAGAQRSDRLRVVVGVNSRPRVNLSGPSRVRPGEEATYTANVTSENPLRSVVWTADGREFSETRLSGERATTTARTVFTASGSDTVRAVVTDVDGDVGVASVETTVSSALREREPAPTGSDGANLDGGGSTGSGAARATSGTDATPASGSGSVRGQPDRSAGPTAGQIDISQSAQRGEFVQEPDISQPAPAVPPEPPSTGGDQGGGDIVDILVEVVVTVADSVLV